MPKSPSDSNGWTWVFRKDKIHKQKPIDNPFGNVLERIATSFFVSNFPDSLDSKGLWNVCKPFGRIVDAFIANKRSKLGKRFGFIRFLGVRHEEEFAKSLSTIWIGSFHLLFVSVAQGESVSNDVSQDKEKPLSIQLNDDDLIKVEDTSKVDLVKVKNIDTINNLYCVCRNEGFAELKIHHVGGLWVWFQFNSKSSCEAFKANESLKKLWSYVKTVSSSFLVDERMIWLEIQGLPLCTWGSIAYKKVASLFGNFLFFDSDSEICMGWSINITDDLEVTDSEDDADRRSVNVAENQLDDLDDLMQPFEEENEILCSNHHENVSGNTGDKHVEVESDGSRPRGFENVLFNTNKDLNSSKELNPGNVSKVSDSHNVSCNEGNSDDRGPPGFEYVTKMGKGGTQSFPLPRSNKYSTSFGNFRRKDIKGYSIIDELNRIIEVGGIEKNPRAVGDECVC
ncbi:RNA-directed DNA polymerase, eukaryota, reverse transcriptase zinc-binding domain protein [Tanacetum coccineum]